MAHPSLGPISDTSACPFPSPTTCLGALSPQPSLLSACPETHGLPPHVMPRRSSRRGGTAGLCSSQGIKDKWEKGTEGSPGLSHFSNQGQRSPEKHQLNVLKPQGTETSLPCALPPGANRSWAFLSGQYFLPGASSSLSLAAVLAQDSVPSTVAGGTGHSLPFCCCL